MPGFLSSNVAMTICSVESPKTVTPDALRKGAFTDALDPEGKRYGWTGLGELLDTENFFLALEDGRFCGFSYRLDSRKPAQAVVRLQLAERIRDEESRGAKVGAKRKRELKEEIVETLTLQCDFAPVLIDCIWDIEAKRLYVATLSQKLLERVLAHFKGTFAMDAIPIAPEKDMSEVFSAIQGAGGIQVEDVFLEAIGTASLKSSPQNTERQSIAVQNSQDAVAQALTNGLAIDRMSFAAREDGTEEEWKFTLNTDLAVSGLRLPKPEKGAEMSATFLINATRCAKTADVVVALSVETDED